MKLMNIDQLPDEFISVASGSLVTKLLGHGAGSVKLYVNIDSIQPRTFSTKFHSHSVQEEFFLVLSGTGILRLNGEEKPVKQGDFFAKPGGRDIAHTFYNDGGVELVILDIGTKEAEDTCYYPDEDVYMQKSNGKCRVYKGVNVNSDWSSEPNSSNENEVNSING